VGVQSDRMDRDSSAPSSPRFAGCLPVVPLPLMAGSNAPHSTPLTASTARRRDTLECTCCSEAGFALRVRV
jgi:hypothetical protein